MSDIRDETSVLRQGVITAMTRHVVGNPVAAATLARELDRCTYDRRTDSALFELAELVGVPTDRLAELSQLDPTRIPEHPTVLCDVCSDTGAVRRPMDDRFERCPRCNPEPRPEEGL